MKRLFKRIVILGISVLLAGVAVSSAQQPKPEPAKSPTGNMTQGQVTKGFTLPQYTDGKLTAMINGGEARVISVNRTEITALRVDLYEDGKVATTITSPKSDYWNADNKMRTRFGVEIVRSDMTVTAQTMEWEIKEQRGVLRQNVKVVLNSLDLAKPAETPNPAASAPLGVPAPGTEPLTTTESSPLQLQQSPASSTPSTLLPP